MTPEEVRAAVARAEARIAAWPEWKRRVVEQVLDPEGKHRAVAPRRSEQRTAPGWSPGRRVIK